MVWGPPGCAKSEVAQQVAAEGGRTYCDVRALLLDPVDLRGIPWRDGDNRTRWAPPDFLPPTDSTDALARQPGGAPLRRADGAGGALPARPRPQVRGVRAPRRRLAHGLRQPRERPGRGASDAHPAGVPLRPPRDQGRPVGLVRMGSRERYRARDPLLHPAQARAASPVRCSVARGGLRMSEDMGVRLERREPARRPRPGRGAGAVPRRRGRGGSGRVLGLPQGLARAAPSRGPSSTIPRTPTCPTMRAR